MINSTLSIDGEHLDILVIINEHVQIDGGWWVLKGVVPSGCPAGFAVISMCNRIVIDTACFFRQSKHLDVVARQRVTDAMQAHDWWYDGKAGIHERSIYGRRGIIEITVQECNLIAGATGSKWLNLMQDRQHLIVNRFYQLRKTIPIKCRSFKPERNNDWD